MSIGYRWLDTSRRNKLRHFHQRLLERLGMMVSEEWVDQQIIAIDAYENKPLIIDRGDGRSFHLVSANGVEFVAIFDWEVMCFCTAFPKSWISNHDTEPTMKKRKKKVSSNSVTARGRRKRADRMSPRLKYYSDDTGDDT